MRTWLIVSLLILPGCDSGTEVNFFGQDSWSSALSCSVPVVGELGATVVDLAAVGDSAFAVLFRDERRLGLFDHRLQAVAEYIFDKDGPRGIRNPVSAAITDTAVYVLDEAGLLKRFDRSGNYRASVTLKFIPRRVRASQAGVFVLPLVAGSSPSSLLFQIDGDRVRQFDAPIAMYEDIGINTFANMASIAVFSNRLALMHEMVVPFGYVLRAVPGASSIQRFPVPIPDAMRGSLNRMPKPPLSEKNVNELTMVAFTAAANPQTGSTYYVTRLPVGRARFQKILVELDSTMQFRNAFPIPVHPHHMVYLAARSSILGVNANSEWFECRLS